MKQDKFVRLLLSGKVTAKQAERALRQGADPNAPDRYGLTPLSAASACASAGVITTLVRAGADIHHRMRHWRLLPIVVSAAMNDDPEVLAALIRFGADPNQRDGYDRPALVAWFSWAGEARLGRIPEDIHFRVVSRLLKVGADPLLAQQCAREYSRTYAPIASVVGLLGAEGEEAQEQYTTNEEASKLITGDDKGR